MNRKLISILFSKFFIKLALSLQANKPCEMDKPIIGHLTLENT